MAAKRFAEKTVMIIIYNFGSQLVVSLPRQLTQAPIEGIKSATIMSKRRKGWKHRVILLSAKTEVIRSKLCFASFHSDILKYNNQNCQQCNAMVNVFPSNMSTHFNWLFHMGDFFDVSRRQNSQSSLLFLLCLYDYISQCKPVNLDDQLV